MMNEFYELKPGETVRNVLMYNSPTVILADLKKKYNYFAEEKISVPIFVSHYGGEDIQDGEVTIRLICENKVLKYEKITSEYINNGAVTRCCDCLIEMPRTEKPLAMKLYVTLSGKEIFAENEWEIYVFPKKEIQPTNVSVSKTKDIDELIKMLHDGKNILILGAGPFASKETSFRISLAGRTEGNLATCVNDHPALGDIPHEGFCGWQFAEMLEGGSAVCFETDGVPFNPIIEIVSTHKCVIRQSALFEFSALNGRLLVASFDFKENYPASKWLLSQLISYMESDSFNPKDKICEEKLKAMADWKIRHIEKNRNFAFNANDKTTAQ